MTQSPADEYERSVSTGDRAREATESRSLLRRTLDRARDGFGRALDRARDGFDRCVTAVRRLVGGEPPPDRSLSRTGRSDQPRRSARSDSRADRSSATVSHIAVNTDDASTDTATRLPERDRPFTRPPRDDGDDNPPKPVARVDGEKLTVELSDRPDASITSDVWERVEP